VLAGVIHEMSNPLAVINGCAQLLNMESLPKGIEEHVQRIHSEAQRTSDLIKKVLSFARKEKEEKERFRLPDVVEEAAVLKDFSLKNDKIKIVRRHNNATPLLVEGYKVQLTQVVLNLLNNSEQAIRGDAGSGKIFVETNRCDRDAMISISDNGPGISPEDRNRVFDAFFTTKDESKGTGLGLYISRQIIQNHGGDLSLASSSGDQTVFQIRLPLLNPEDISQEDAKTAEAGLF
jgi:signal transduction histidine kinase